MSRFIEYTIGIFLVLLLVIAACFALKVVLHIIGFLFILGIIAALAAAIMTGIERFHKKH